MSLYLHPSISPQDIREAKASGIVYGVKSYPAGVTTNSESGVVDYTQFHPVFEAMEQHDLVLNLHGEVPSSESGGVTVLNAEEAFLPTLLDLHRNFPRLRIVLEHCTTAAAIKAVEACGPTVVGTITAHHLFLTIDDVVGDPLNFCKPVAKLPADRRALLRTAVSGHRKFFFGSDSAPHLLVSKRGGLDVGSLAKCAAGVFTQPYATQLVLHAIEAGIEQGVLTREDANEDKIRGFLGEYGREFYKLPPASGKIRIRSRSPREKVAVVPVATSSSKENVDVVVPFRNGMEIYSLEGV